MTVDVFARARSRPCYGLVRPWLVRSALLRPAGPRLTLARVLRLAMRVWPVLERPALALLALRGFAARRTFGLWRRLETEAEKLIAKSVAHLPLLLLFVVRRSNQ